jgi:hypothetical protein
MLQLAKVLGLLLVNICLGSILFIFNLFIFNSNFSQFFLDFFFNSDYLLKAENFSLTYCTAALLINSKNNNIPQSVKKYNNAVKDRDEILTDNKGKSGIYIITNELTKKKYVGSSYDLAKRLGKHTNIEYINKYKGNSKLYSSIKKYGLENFSVSILEFCEKDSLLVRENYFIKLLQPELNIAQIAGAPFTGRFNNAETKKQMSEFKKGITPIIAIAASNHSCSFPVQLLNVKTNEINIFPSIRKAATYLNCHHSSLQKSLKNKNLYKKTYKITKLIK